MCRTLPGYKLLLTIPGFGPYISALVLTALADPFRFASRKQVIHLAGLDLNANTFTAMAQLCIFSGVFYIYPILNDKNLGLFVGAQNPQRDANQGPQVHHRVPAAVMLAELMDLGMSGVATGNAIVGTRSLDLLILEPSVFKALLLEYGLEETAATATTIIVGPNKGL